ncbi:hypothetical protein HDU88_002549, partial [Geranomyces variabilis]
WVINFKQLDSLWYLAVVDHFTKFITGEIFTTKETVNVATFLHNEFERHGHPQVILADNGGKFVCEVLTQVYKTWGVGERHGLPYHLQTQGR